MSREIIDPNEASMRIDELKGTCVYITPELCVGSVDTKETHQRYILTPEDVGMHVTSEIEPNMIWLARFPLVRGLWIDQVDLTRTLYGQEVTPPHQIGDSEGIGVVHYNKATRPVRHLQRCRGIDVLAEKMLDAGMSRE